MIRKKFTDKIWYEQAWTFDEPPRKYYAAGFHIGQIHIERTSIQIYIGRIPIFVAF